VSYSRPSGCVSEVLSQCNAGGNALYNHNGYQHGPGCILSKERSLLLCVREGPTFLGCHGCLGQTEDDEFLYTSLFPLVLLWRWILLFAARILATRRHLSGPFDEGAVVNISAIDTSILLRVYVRCTTYTIFSS
jgi:hypothetical protein